MTLARSTAWTLLVGAGFALFAGSARAQPMALPTKDSAAVGKVVEYRDIPRGGIPKEELKAAKENFAKFAKYYADVVAHPSVYKAPQEFKLPAPGTRVLSIDGPEGILQDLDRFVWEPGTGTRKVGPDQAVYARELGAALDATFKKLIETDPEPIVRVNAARVLAYICKGGSTAHYATLTELISNANTRTEVKYYLFHAAANLLAASDPNWLKTRNHPGQTDDPKMVGALVKAIDDCITNPALLVAGLPDNKADNATLDQLAVIRLVRRQAIKALAQVRYVVVTGPNGPLYPVYTLTRVALTRGSLRDPDVVAFGDPKMFPAPGPADAAEAVIGICNMAPAEAKGDRVVAVKYNADAAVEAVTFALVTFARPRAEDAFDRKLPWRSYSLRIAEAIRNWRPLFDPDFDITLPNKFAAALVPVPLEELFKEVIPKILAPMDKVDGLGKPDAASRVDIEWLETRLTGIRNNPKRSTTMFPGNAQTTIDFAPAKK